MTWTKLILILSTGVVLAVVLRYVISPEHTISFYRSTYHGGAEGAAQGKIYWEIDPNVLAFWVCLIVTLILTAVLGGRMLLRR